MYFTKTCDKPYDAHTYELVFTNGKTLHFDDWESVQRYWFDTKNKKELNFIEVHDPKPPKSKKSKEKGFK